MITNPNLSKKRWSSECDQCNSHCYLCRQCDGYVTGDMPPVWAPIDICMCRDNLATWAVDSPPPPDKERLFALDFNYSGVYTSIHCISCGAFDFNFHENSDQYRNGGQKTWFVQGLPYCKSCKGDGT